MVALDLVTESEVVKVSRFLESNFPSRNFLFWEKSIFSILEENSINGIDNAGYIYCKDNEPYAAILIIYSKAKQGFSLSSWAVHPEISGIAYPFLRAVLNKLKHKAIYNHSAVTGVRELMEAVGFTSINKAAIPFPSCRLTSFKAVANISSRLLGQNIIQIENARCLKIRVKLCSMTKNGSFRRLAMMVGANREPSEIELREVSLYMALRAMVFICPKSPFLYKCWNLESFETLANIKNIKMGKWFDTFAQSEYEIMEF